MYFEEGFESVPPSGWSINGHPGNWSSDSSSNAGGTAPEARFSWDPPFDGESYLISPVIDLTGQTSVSFNFKHSVDHYGDDYTLLIATRSGSGDWTIVWEIVNPTASIPGEEVSISISNSDVGQADFEIAFAFLGNSYNINYWYIDNAKLFVPLSRDVSTQAILGDTYYDMGDSYEAIAEIKNAGLNTETFDVVLEIYNSETNDLLFTDTQNITELSAGDEVITTFTGYELPLENAMYEIVVYTDLPGDMNPDNDIFSRYIYTYTASREMVLLEIGTGTWCGLCPGAAMGADDLIANAYNVAIIENHYGDDYANQFSDSRNIYYEVVGYPTAVFDGVESFVGGSATQSLYSIYLPLFESRADIMSAYACMLYGENTGGSDYSIKAKINKLGTALNENVVFHIALTESHIPETWLNQDHVNFVNRLMMPDENGTMVNIGNNDSINVQASFTIEPGWDVNECELVYFLQDLGSKEVLQGGKVMVNDLIPFGIKEDLSNKGVAVSNIYPNPFTNTTNINFSLARKENVVISIYDMTGREVGVLVNTEMTAGDHQISWEVNSNIPDGIYFCTVKTSVTAITQKIILTK